MSSLNIPELCAQVYARVFSSLIAAGHPLGLASQRAWQAHDRAHDDLTGHAPADQPAPRPDPAAEWLRELYSRIVDAPAVGSSLVAERYRLLSADRVSILEVCEWQRANAWDALGRIAAAVDVAMEGKTDAAVADAVIASVTGRIRLAEHQRQMADMALVALQNLGFTGGGLDAWVERTRQTLADAETMRARWEEMARRLDAHERVEEAARVWRVGLCDRLGLTSNSEPAQISARAGSLMLLREQVAEHLGPWCGGIAALGAAPKLAADALRAAEKRIAALEAEIAEWVERTRQALAESRAAEKVTETGQRDELLVAYRLWRAWAVDLGVPMTFRPLDTHENRRACADEDMAARYRLSAQLQAPPATVETARLGDEAAALRSMVASLRNALAAIGTEVHLDSTASHHEIREAVVARLAALGKDAEGMRRQITSLRAQRDAALRTIESATEMLERWQAPGDGVVLHLCAAGARAHIDRQAARIAELEDAAEKAKAARIDDLDTLCDALNLPSGSSLKCMTEQAVDRWQRYMTFMADMRDALVVPVGHDPLAHARALRDFKETAVSALEGLRRAVGDSDRLNPLQLAGAAAEALDSLRSKILHLEAELQTER